MGAKDVEVLAVTVASLILGSLIIAACYYIAMWIRAWLYWRRDD